MAERDRALVEQAHRLRELAAEPYWETLRVYVQQAVDRKLRHLVQGGARTYDEYREAAGWLQGAQFVLNAAEGAEQAAERSGE